MMDNEQLMQMLVMMNPELAPIVAMMQTQAEPEKPKRKPSAYNRRYSAAYKRIKRKKTLKSGKMMKGYANKKGGLSKAGHAKIRDAAHKEARRK